jgi:anaerobic selenocysteine-containing dehydrogenase
MAARRTAYRICPLCEATCGLELTMQGDRVAALRGDGAHVFSRGYICPKAIGLARVEEDPDRLRTPLVRRDGRLVMATWDDAFAEVHRRLPPILERHGRDAVAAYVGNPNAHHLSGALYVPILMRALGTRNVFSASTVDQMPKHVSSGLMFGAALSVPIPDVDRTQHLVMLGANPLESNGSLFTGPDMRGRLRRLRERGGRLVVIDPRRTRTAEIADEHHFIRPGSDAHLLAAIANALLGEGLAKPGRLLEHLNGYEQLPALLAPFTAEAVAPHCRIDADTIRRLARDLAAAPSAAVYGRIGTCTVEFGTLTSWLVDVVNILTGNLDREGGAMFTRAAAGARNTSGRPGKGRGMSFGRWHSRVRGLPEALGELPVACLAEEIDTPGDGQVRALLTIAGNPALSTPNSGRLRRALESLEFMVSVDIYLNETTRHADVILPPPSALNRSHYDIALYQLAVRNIASYSPPVLPLASGELDEWEILLRLAAIAMGQGAHVDDRLLDDQVARQAVEREVSTPGSPVEGRDPQEVLDALSSRRGPDRLLDLMLRTGPYGDGFNGHGGLSLAALEAAPHGIDLGPLQPRIPEVLRTASGKIEVLPEAIAGDMPRLQTALRRDANGLVLIGRRDMRSNNSWMHNVSVLVRGPVRCTAQLHPDDAARLGVDDGGMVRITSAAGTVEIVAEVTDVIMPGVVSIPHGWGHDDPETNLSVAAAKPGVNCNVLVDETIVDPLSGNAVLNGVAVTVAPVEVTAAV